MHFQLKPESEYTNQGYLYLMEKSNAPGGVYDFRTIIINTVHFPLVEAFTATWQKNYCTYKKQNKQFSMLQYNQQIPGRIVSIRS
jgi:hypothetical protein